MRHRTQTIYSLLVLLILLSISPSSAATRSPSPASLLDRKDAALLIDPSGNVVFTHNTNQPLIPASTLKILTSLVALHHLGSDYRCITEFYISPGGDLKIKGYGDPLLTSEVLADLASQIASQTSLRSRPIADLVLDTSGFQTPLAIPGTSVTTEPYDAPNGALIANFNTVNFNTDPRGRIVTAEPQTPLLPFALEKIRSSGLASGRILLSNDEGEATLYAGHLMRHFLHQKGIAIRGDLRLGEVETACDRRIYTHRSPFTLEQIVEKLLEYSNNYVANQLLVLTGVAVYGSPGTLEKGLKAVNSYAAEVLGNRRIRVAEGSGISRMNRISASDMASVLLAFEPHHRLMRNSGREFYKTGTLKGIQTRAGYIEDGDGERHRYVVFINTPGRSIDGIMDRILQMVP